MITTVLEVRPKYLVVQFTDPQTNCLERKLVARAHFPDHSTKGLLPIPRRILNRSISYSDVDLFHRLGVFVSNTQTLDLVREFRRAGLWTKEDFRADANLVNLIVKRVRGDDLGVNPNDILQVALL